MSAINPIIQTPPRLSPDQFNTSAGQSTAPAAQQGFSDTLNSVGAKPVRRSASSKTPHPNGGGDTLPDAGKASPPATPAASNAAPAASSSAAQSSAAPAGPAAAGNSAATGAPASGAAAAAGGNAAAASPTADATRSADAARAASAAADAATAATAAHAAAAATAASATSATGAAPATDASAAADAAPAADASPAADAAVSNSLGVAGKDAPAAAIDSSGAQSSPPGQAGGIPQSAAAAQASALAATHQTAPGTTANGATSGEGARAAAANAAPGGQAPTPKVAAKQAASTPTNWIAGRSSAAMRAIYPTGNSGATPVGKAPVTGQDAGSAPMSDASAAAATPAAQIDTAAMIGAMQANSPAPPTSAGEAQPVMPAGNPSDTTSGPLSLVGANGDVPSALPALAAAAASAAQMVSTIAAGAAADKKSHDSQNQIASTDGASPASDAAGAAQLLNAQGSAHTDTGAVPTFKVNAAVDSPEFGQNVSSHVSTMLDGNVNSAKLQVNPPALGPIEVRISIQGDHAQVWMASHSAMTRDALQDAAPQLREMLNSQGFAQVSVDISQRSFQERTPMAHAYEWNGESNAASTAASGSSASVTSRASSGTLDAYA